MSHRLNWLDVAYGGDYFEAELHDGKVVLTPKVLVDKRVAQEIAESRADFKDARVAGPFTSADDMITSLHAGWTHRKKAKRG